MGNTIDNRASGARIVKPRKPVTNADRPIIAVIDEAACNEEGTLYSTDGLISKLRVLPPQIVVTANESAQLLKRVQTRYGSNPNFNFRVAPVEREIFTGKETGRRLVMSLTSVAYFGWQKEKTGRGNTIRNRYHLLIDPLTFSNNWLDDRSLPAYIAWMQEIRNFCVAQGWNLRPTQGSVARQALQDSRFYPDARRKVPRSTNDRVRSHLPGNHYQLGASVNGELEYEAEYLDQSKCHHFHAQTVKLPDANSLYAFGHYRNPECNKPYKKTPERVAQFLNGFMGLCYGHIYWPISRRKETEFLPKSLREYGTPEHPANEPVYFYSEDLPLFESLGIQIKSIVAAWGSKDRDTGLPEYAKWALDELGSNPPVWKKTLLLSTYGALATGARQHTVAFHQSRGGVPHTLVTKHGTRLDVKLHTASKESEPSTNNVLHRALIEASNRTETLLFARYLETLGLDVLCIYVDAVLVASQNEIELPLIQPWRLDTHLTHLKFISESQFVAAELEKLPGVSGAELRAKVARGSFRGPYGGRTERLGGWEGMARRAYDEWLRWTETRSYGPSAMDGLTPGERWEILDAARHPDSDLTMTAWSDYNAACSEDIAERPEALRIGFPPLAQAG